MVSFGNIVCIIEGWSLVQVIENNVTKMNKGVVMHPYLTYFVTCGKSKYYILSSFISSIQIYRCVDVD